MTTLVLDWGVGGLPTFEALRALGHTPTYVSDAGAPPYGTLDHEMLVTRIRWVVRAVGDVSRLVIACNAASTVIEALRLPIPVDGVLSHGATLALKHGGGTIGVIGGQRTIDADIIQTTLKRAGRRVIARVAQPLSAHVEAGRLEGAHVRADVQRALDGMGQVDALLMACTHYPALAPLFTQMLPDATLLDPMDALVEAIGPAQRTPTKPRWFTTGAPEDMAEAAWRAFQIEVGHIERLGGARSP